MDQWLQNNKLRLSDSTLPPNVQSAFDVLRNDDFTQQGLKHQKDLAAAMFQHQDGNPVVEYSHLREDQSWKAAFFSPDTQTTILREASPLTWPDNQFRFLRRLILEYLYSRVIPNPLDHNHQISCGELGAKETRESFGDHPMNWKCIIGEPSTVQFLAKHVEMDDSFMALLFGAITYSKEDVRFVVAVANAIAILVKEGIRFNGMDLRGIRIPGADLLAVSTTCHGIFIFNTAIWTMVAGFNGGPVIAISSSVRELTNSDQESNAVDLGDILSGEARITLDGHNDAVASIVYSPDAP
ncbi:hypothetical protein BGZ47_009984 [Haplosporangium gracile]|nr:hypothetical protein BGZ47_009984 [Haplosporangium gracile]